MKVLTMIIWTFLSWTCFWDGGSSFHVISPPTHLDLLTLSRGYQRIPKDIKGYQRIPVQYMRWTVQLSWPSPCYPPWPRCIEEEVWDTEKTPEDTRRLPEHTNFQELFEMGGPSVLAFLLLPILTSSSKEPTPQFHQSSPFVALAQVFPFTNINKEFEILEKSGKGLRPNKYGNIAIYTINMKTINEIKKCREERERP